MPRSRSSKKEPKVVYWYASEGAVTERYYMDFINKMIRGSSKVLKPIPGGRDDPKNLLIRVKRCKEISSNDHVCLIFDPDCWPNSHMLDIAKWENEKPSLRKVAKTIPCFEIWLLLHFECINGRSIEECKRRLVKHKVYNDVNSKSPNMDVFDKGSVERAINNAKMLGNNKMNNALGMAEFVEELLN